MKYLFLGLCGFILGTGALASAAEGGADASTLLMEAETQAGRGDHSGAAQSLAEAVKAAPDQEPIQFRLATQLVFQRKFDQASEIFTRLAGSSNVRIAALAKDSLSALRDEEARRSDFERRANKMRVQGNAERDQQSVRNREFRRREADQQAKQDIYDLFAAGETEQGLNRFAAYESGNTVPIDLRYSAIYAMQRQGRAAEAAAALDALPVAEQSSPRWLLARGRTARAMNRDGEAWKDFDAARIAAAGTPLADEAEAEITALPMEANLNRWAWGELQLDAVHLFRFADTIFYGQVRQGTFIPGARWIQPFLQADFTVDTNSGVTNGVSQVYANNLAGIHAGVRIRPFAQESIWLYGMVGIQNDLRGTTRFDGGWFFDWRVGARAFKGFGPGLSFATDPDFTVGFPGSLELRPRAAWFVELGADGAYYSLYENFIAFYAAREGIRFLEVGSRIGLDVYALQQGTVDGRGLYYNNFFEVGAGVRATARLSPGVSLITRLEAVGGAYLGRDAELSRGTLGSNYGDVRITVSLWAEW